MKKLLSTLVLFVCLSSIFSAMAEDQDDEARWKLEPAFGKPVKVGYDGGLCLGTFGIAHIKGFYKEEGLETEIVRMGNTPIDALGTGKVDVAGSHIAALMVPTVNGVRIKFTTGIHTGCKSLYVLTESEVQNTRDLVGKTVAIPDGIGSSDHNIALRFMNHDQVDPLTVKYKAVEAGATILAMQNGEIQAALLNDQFAKKFLDAGVVRMVRSLSFDEDFKQETCCIHAINKNFFEKNPITARKMTRVHNRAKKWVMENREEAVKILLENNWAAGDPETVLQIFNSYSYDVSDQSTEQTLRDIINDYKTFGLIKTRKETEDILREIWEPVPEP